MSPSVPARRLLLVHAHPDDETITTGATMAHYVAQGVQVTVVTCTLGEEGEILVPAYAQLEAAQADQLGGYRIAELDAAMRALGVLDHRFLGGAGRFRDSGMMGSPANRHPRAFWRAADDADVFATAVGLLADVVREVRPQVVVTYDDNGDYGHPDHVMAHRITTAALEATRADGSWYVAKFYWTATPRSALSAAYDALRERDDVPFEVADEPTFGVDDDVVTCVIDAADQWDAKRAALLAHRTQLAVHGRFFALTNMLGRAISATEHYRLAVGKPGRDGVEDDLFAGIPA
ncbi:N-acetyl-1-D-myo-inositol-2-amino-2-deoxy-alpha-D-glucopyranoside deacetylase [Jatrophihabitans fulvus]